MNDLTIIVSVICATYNHEKYITETIEGFVRQKTTFPIEFIIHDDASTDGTADIIREYESKYPEIIKPIYQSVNGYGTGRNTKTTMAAVRGKYIAMCEGDDYWTDPLKLQRQVDFLEDNPDYGLVHTDYKEFIQTSDEEGYLRMNQYKARGVKNTLTDPDDVFFSQLNFNEAYHIRTLTVCLRKDLFDQAMENNSELYRTKKLLLGDTPIFLEMSRLTKFKYFEESMGVYRMLPESAAHSRSSTRKLKHMNSACEIQDFFIHKYGCSKSIYEKLMRKRNESYLSFYSFSKNKNQASDYYSKISPKFLNHRLLYTASGNVIFHFIYFEAIKNLKLLLSCYHKIWSRFYDKEKN